MVHLTIGPEQTSAFRNACQYMCHRLGLQECHLQSYNQEHGLVRTLKPGSWGIDDINIVFKFGEAHILENGRYVQDVQGSISGLSMEAVNSFLKTATEYTENLLLNAWYLFSIYCLP